MDAEEENHINYLDIRNVLLLKKRARLYQVKTLTIKLIIDLILSTRIGYN